MPVGKAQLFILLMALFVLTAATYGEDDRAIGEARDALNAARQALETARRARRMAEPVIDTGADISTGADILTGADSATVPDVLLTRPDIATAPVVRAESVVSHPLSRKSDSSPVLESGSGPWSSDSPLTYFPREYEMSYLVQPFVFRRGPDSYAWIAERLESGIRDFWRRNARIEEFSSRADVVIAGEYWALTDGVTIYVRISRGGREFAVLRERFQFDSEESKRLLLPRILERVRRTLRVGS